MIRIAKNKNSTQNILFNIYTTFLNRYLQCDYLRPINLWPKIMSRNQRFYRNQNKFFQCCGTPLVIISTAIWLIGSLFPIFLLAQPYIGGRYVPVRRQIALMQVFSWNDEVIMVIMDRGVSRRLRRACFLFHTLLSGEVYFEVLICSCLTNAAHIRSV